MALPLALPERPRQGRRGTLAPLGRDTDRGTRPGLQNSALHDSNATEGKRGVFPSSMVSVAYRCWRTQGPCPGLGRNISSSVTGVIGRGATSRNDTVHISVGWYPSHNICAVANHQTTR